MSVRQSLLAILDQGPCYGYQLRTEFERRTGGGWPLNVGQIYQTLERLERDGLVSKRGAASEGRAYYEITDAGREAVASWFSSPVIRATAARDELPIKLAVAATLPGVDVARVIDGERAAVRELRARLAADAGAGAPRDAAELASALLTEARSAQLDAELRWLDRAEELLAQASVPPLPLSTEVPKRGRPARAVATD